MKMKRLQIIPLGGLGEVGKNMTVVQYEDELFIVDAGIVFPDEGMYGVDVVIPDFDYLRKNKDLIKGLIITHGHEDHIGAISYFIKEFDVPIYATKLTAALITNKLRYAKASAKNLNIIKDEHMVLKYKKCHIEFFRTHHSIPDSVGVVINTPVGTVVHTGDFKIDYAPVDGKFLDFQRLGEIGKKGVLALLSDSTNSEKPGVSLPEISVAENLEKYIQQAKGRVIAATFASSIHRVQSLISIAEKANRKVAVVGKSMEKNIKICTQLGYLNLKEDTIISPKEIKNYRRDEVLIITTGAQGEILAGLSRLASGENKNVALEEDDTVVFSSGTIPGNEKAVGNLVNSLLKKGVQVIQDKAIHTSGHGYQDEQRLLLSILRPKYFIPCHGEYRMLLSHSKIAQQVGIPAENIFICENGDIVEFTDEGAVKNEKVQAGAILVDTSGLGDVNINVMRDRRRMAEQGVAVVIVKIIPDERKVKVSFDFKGIVARIDKSSLNKDLVKAVEERLQSKERSESLKKALTNDFAEVIYQHVKRKPLIMIPSIEFDRQEKEKGK